MALPKWLQPLVSPLAAAALAALASSYAYTWQTADERARLAVTLANINETMKAQASRIAELERSDRESLQIPARLDDHLGRISRLEEQERQARLVDRTTAERLARVETAVQGIAANVSTIAQDVRELRNDRRHGGLPSMPPTRAGDPIPLFRQP